MNSRRNNNGEMGGCVVEISPPRRSWPARVPGIIPEKQIERLEDWGYTVTRQGKYRPSGSYTEWIVKHPDVLGGRMPIAKFQIEDEEDDAVEVVIPWCFNGEFDLRPAKDKLALRDMVLGVLYFHAERDVTSLMRIKYTTVLEESLDKVLAPKVYELMALPPATTLTVHRFGTRAGEQEAFGLLMSNAVFCIGIGKMLKEYSEYSEAAGRECQAFEFQWIRETGDWNFIVHI